MHTLQEPLGSLSATLRERFAQIGPVWGRDINAHRDLVIAAYSPLVAAARDAGEPLEVARDIAYGDHERQRLDVFASARSREKGNADVVLFVHGGAFLRGSKSFNGLIYDNVSRVVAAGGTYLTGRHEKDPNVFYEVKYRMPDGTVFDITENGWKGAVKEVAPAAQAADPQA